MRRKIFISFIALMVLTLGFQSCVKDLVEEGIYVTTRYYGVIQDMNTLQPLAGMKVVSTNGDNVKETVFTDDDGSFSINMTVQQLNEGYFLSIQPDSLYQSQNIYLDRAALGVESYNIGVIKIKGPTVPELTTGNVTDITASSARLHGIIKANGNSAINECGFVYDVVQYPTIENHKVVSSINNGSIDAQIQLLPNTTYYVRAFARNSIGIGYGQQIAFRTLDGLPTIANTTVFNIKTTRATCSGSFTSDGGFAITARGICWSTSPDPTIDNLHVNLGTGLGDFETDLTNLQPNTTYYLRAYARNTSGIAYSEPCIFTTLSGYPTVVTTLVSDITCQSAIAGGNVTSDGEFPVLQRGVCFSTTPLPTTHHLLLPRLRHQRHRYHLWRTVHLCNSIIDKTIHNEEKYHCQDLAVAAYGSIPT